MDNKSFEFICLGSGSTGNSYVIRKDCHCILVECGFTYAELIGKLLIYNISLTDIDAVVISHQHNDHARCMHKLVELGMEVYAPACCFLENELSNCSNVHVVYDNSAFTLNSQVLMKCFATVHDVESYGYIFADTETKESTLFLTDSRLFEFRYWNLSFDYIFIECNHIRKQLEAMMQTALNNGKEGEVYKLKRQASYHLSLAACKKFLRHSNLSKTKGIFLIHLSKEVCNDVVVRAEIRETFKIPTFVCFAQGGMN